MKITIELSSDDIKELVVKELQRQLGDIQLDATKVKIETRSKQNYKSEWETADYRVKYEQ